MHPVARVLVAVLCTFGAQSPPLAAASLNDTGQVVCYDNTASTGTSEALGFEGQDCRRGAAAAEVQGVQVKVGGSSISGRDYTRIANNGGELPSNAAQGSAPGDWGCTRDNLTGLTWELRPNDNGLRDRDHRYAWYVEDGAVNGGNAGVQVPDEVPSDTCGGTLAQCNVSAYRAAVNAASMCGANDWRLPRPQELNSLVVYSDTGDIDVLIDRAWFPDLVWDGVHSLQFWSGQSAPVPSFLAPPNDTDTSQGWAMDFQYGGAAQASKTTGLYLRLVRGGQ